MRTWEYHGDGPIAEVVTSIRAPHTDKIFHYLVPPRLRGAVVPGSRVVVPFGPRMVEGYVVGLLPEPDVEPVREIAVLIDEEGPSLTPDLIALAKWMAGRYLCTLSSAFQAVLPPGRRAAALQVLSVHEERFLQAARAGALAPAEEELCRTLLRRKKRPLVSWLSLRPDWGPVLESLLARGILGETIDVSGQAKEKRVYQAQVDPVQGERFLRGDEAPRARRQMDLVQHLLAAGGPVAVPELLRATGAPRSALLALAEKGIVRLDQVSVRRDPYQHKEFVTSQPLALLPEQQAAVDAITRSLEGTPEHYLLHGVTGSGKTEVYLQAIGRCLALSRQAIVLVPEISLTPQIVRRFKERFGDRLAVLHSRLSVGERYDEWLRIRRGIVQIAVGARSAIFAPFSDIGLIIVDEEHELSYKQEEHPKYMAREVALERARLHRATLVFGSATPSLESAMRAIRKECRVLSMPARVNRRPLPAVRIVDMRQELKEGNRSMFSRALYQGIAQRLNRREQIILFLNRRGYAAFVLCRACGHVVSCPSCDISLTYHRTGSNLRCHYCGYAEPYRRQCPRCQSEHIRHFGTGTQKVEEELLRQFPSARTIRMDVDTTSGKGSHEAMIEAFANGEADILLGTQMIAKGLDFPRVTLVGVVSADTALHVPDFRAAERTFQLLTQVAGRAGRHELEGEIVIQTYAPDHYAVVTAAKQNYRAFLEREITVRKAAGYPPYTELSRLVFLHAEERSAKALANEAYAHLKQAVSGGIPLTVLAPAPAPLARMEGMYRYHIVLKYTDWSTVRPVLEPVYARMLGAAARIRGKLSVDVDAQLIL